MAEPTADAVYEIASISGCNEDTARRWLKVKSNNNEAALNAIFDGEDLVKAETSVTWNESEFSSDRDGNTAFGPQNYSFNDGNLRPLGQSAAPTRGSSPVPSLQQPSSRAQEDAEMQRAIAASQQDQDVGILSSGNFGPATKGHYDPSNWAMTTLSAPVDSHGANEIIPDLEPNDRQNRPGEPRFLKHLPSGDYLPNLLTIAHSIPSAHDALLAPHVSHHSYGSDAEWWKGHAIRLPKIVSTVSGAAVEPATSHEDDIISEMQRLVALLDESSRSYGSADSLIRLAVSDSDENLEVITESILDKVLSNWETAIKKADPDHSTEYEVFHSLIGTTSPDGLRTPNMWSLPLSVSTETEQSVSLAEVMDNTLWDMDPDDLAFCDNYMQKCAEILPMRVTQSNPSKDTLGIVIPPVFFVDKYLKENVEVTREVRKQMAQSKKKLEKIDSVQSKLKSWKHPQKGSDMDASLLLKHAVDYFSGESRRVLQAERESNGVGSEAVLPSQPVHHGAIAEKLNAVCRNIETKLQALENEKDKVRKALSELSQGVSPSLSKHRYWLRGVATKPHVTYLLQSRDPNDTETVDDEDVQEGMQWWRVEYDVQVSGAKVVKTKSTQDDVIRAAELEHNQALLVYASDWATSTFSDIELPQALKEFIRQDDANFDLELREAAEYSNVNIYPQFETNQRRGSGDSTIANFADDEPPPYEDFNNVSYELGDRKDELMDSVQYISGESPPAHEIKLDDMQQEGEGAEMIEKVHAPLYTPGVGMHGNGSDDTMAEATQNTEQVDKNEVE